MFQTTTQNVVVRCRNTGKNRSQVDSQQCRPWLKTDWADLPCWDGTSGNMLGWSHWTPHKSGWFHVMPWALGHSHLSSLVYKADPVRIADLSSSSTAPWDSLALFLEHRSSEFWAQNRKQVSQASLLRSNMKLRGCMRDINWNHKMQPTVINYNQL